MAFLDRSDTEEEEKMVREIEWYMHSIRADFREIGNRLGIDPVMARILVNRGQSTPEMQERYLYGTLDDIPAPELLRNCTEAAELLAEKIREGKHIRIISDYDVDGVTSCVVLIKALTRLSAKVSYDIPDRIRDGYGMNVRMVEEAARDGVDTLLTADNGTAAFEAVSRAKELGLTVIVTDHHQIQDGLPEADLLLNPWQPGCPYPFKEICGVEVAYKLMLVLSEKLGNPLPRGAFLDFVALGTVCDVMPLQEENRILVREGMRRMPDTENVGLRALLSVNGLLDGKKITVYHLGFILGPAINSEGRLSSAKEAMKLFLTEDPKEANRMAEEMRELNESRKSATMDGLDWAVGFLEESGPLRDHVIVLRIPGLHESLAGIVAGKLKERYYRPTIVFTDSEDDPTLLKGSGRSISDYDMFEALSRVKDMTTRFGGHKMAAGLTIRKEMLEDFRRKLNEEDGLTEEQLIEKVYLDVPMPMSYVSLSLAEQLEQLEPFGNGNQKPLFAEKGLLLRGMNRLGRDGNTLRLHVEDTKGNRSELLMFQGEELLNDIKMWSEPADRDIIGDNVSKKAVHLDVMYQVSVNEFRGERSAQCRLVHYRKTAED